MPVNPYAAPASVVVDRDDGSSADIGIREAHVRHEQVLKSIGSLYWFGALTSGLIAIVSAITLATSESGSIAAGLVVGGLYGVFSLIAGFLGFGFRGLRPWVRIPGTILSGIGLLAIPIGTLFNGYILYLIWSAQGQVVLGPDYRGIIERTPHVRYRRTVGDWIALIVIILIGLGIAALIASAMMG
ncbi:MAG: hypothetical protein IPK97_07300 [Ahniella sp.]|nr:hypothetical protein [Ahniella sp.]